MFIFVFVSTWCAIGTIAGSSVCGVGGGYDGIFAVSIDVGGPVSYLLFELLLLFTFLAIATHTCCKFFNTNMEL